ncbi:MAG: hypothetical protein GC178_12635 [Flavobacteriales bacterium]|nr:hypothetical protein [Flavobacteriales bacterium]
MYKALTVIRKDIERKRKQLFTKIIYIMAKLKMALSGLSIPDYIVRTSGISNSVATNVATFATPNPPLATIDAAIQLLAVRQQAVDNKQGKNATYLRDEAKKALHPLIVQLATYVSGVANGNGDIILLSGFKLVDDKSSVGELSPPDTFKRQADGQGTGSIRLSWKGVDRSSGYMASIAPIQTDGEIGAWTTYKAKRLSYTFKNLVSGQLYAMRVATLSAAGQGTWSITVTYRPQ